MLTRRRNSRGGRTTLAGLSLLGVLCLLPGRGFSQASPAPVPAPARAAVTALKAQAASLDNGWSEVSGYFPRQSEPRDARSDKLLDTGKWLYEKTFPHPMSYPALKSSSLFNTMAQFDKDLAPYVAHLHHALGRRVFVFPYDWDKGPDAEIPDFRYLRKFADSLAVDGLYNLVSGRPDEAVDRWLLAMQMGTRMAPNSPLVPAMMGVALRSLGTRALLENLPATPQAGATVAFYRTTAAKLAGVSPLSPALPHILDCEAYLAMSMFDRGQAARQGDLSAATPADRPAYMAWYRQTRELLAAPSGPQQRAQIARLYRTSMERMAGSGAKLAAALVPDMGRALYAVQASDSQAAAGAVLCRLYAWRLDHGSYPQALSQMTELPGDAFSAHRGFGYRRSGGDFLLYSCGLDGVDHHGRGVSYRESASPDKVVGDIIYHQPASAVRR